MNFVLCCILSLLGCMSLCHAQKALNFSVSQSPELIVNAGADSTVLKGSRIGLGGRPTASGGSGRFSYSWAPTTGLNNSLVANPQLQADSSLTYTLTVTDSAGCSRSDQVSIKISSVTSINPVASQIGITIFPNPSRGIIHIRSVNSFSEKKLRLEVYDGMGSRVHSRQINGLRPIQEILDLQGLPAGLYFIRLSGEKNLQVSKIIIN